MSKAPRSPLGGLAELLLPAHVRSQRFRDRHTSVLVLEVLEDGDETAGRRHRRRIERVGHELVAADLAPADVEPTRLVLRAVRAGDDLSVLVLAREPRLDVVLLRRDGPYVPRAYVHDAIRDLEGAVDSLAVRAELLVPRRAVLGAAQDELLDFVELMHPEEALRVDPVPPDLPAEVRAQPDVREGQVVLVDHLVHVHRADRMLRGRDEVQVVPFR